MNNQYDSREISRRDALKLGATGLGALVLAACGSAIPQPVSTGTRFGKETQKINPYNLEIVKINGDNYFVLNVNSSGESFKGYPVSLDFGLIDPKKTSLNIGPNNEKQITYLDKNVYVPFLTVYDDGKEKGLLTKLDLAPKDFKLKNGVVVKGVKADLTNYLKSLNDISKPNSVLTFSEKDFPYEINKATVKGRDFYFPSIEKEDKRTKKDKGTKVNSVNSLGFSLIPRENASLGIYLGTGEIYLLNKDGLPMYSFRPLSQINEAIEEAKAISQAKKTDDQKAKDPAEALTSPGSIKKIMVGDKEVEIPNFEGF